MTLAVEVVNCRIRHIDVDHACVSYKPLTDERTPLGGFQIAFYVTCQIPCLHFTVVPMYLECDLYVTIT